MTDPKLPRPTGVLGKLCAALLVSGALAFAPQVWAQEAPATEEAPAAAPVTADTVVATVGGETITEGDLAFAAEDLAQDLGNIAPEERRPFLLTVLIDMKVMAKAARDAHLDQSDVFKRRLAYLEERALRRAYYAEKIATAVTPEALETAYAEFTAGFQPQAEIRARHILVRTREDADAIMAELEAGKPFDQLAKEKSLDPSGAQNGGDLGFFGRGMMVKPFEDAAFALAEPGQVSEPVESQFGWHIIKLEEKRKSAPPALQEVAQQLQQQLLFRAFDEAVGTLKKDVEISIPDPALAAAVKGQSDPAEE